MATDLTGIAFATDPSELAETDISGFFTGWPNPPGNATFLRLLRGSDYVELAIDEHSGHLVGFITAVSDGVLSAYIPLLEVRQDWQRRGIGSELLRRMLARLDHLYMVDLLCDAHLEPFYASAGLVPAHGMMLRNYECQSGAEGDHVVE
ncbi:MAG: GNAT family N-acetyltransferase [Chloroflexota bacterium]|nr:GNAT family N-acetyltransferase [Chloroflexota bacterium]